MVRRGGAVRGPVRVSYLMGATAAKQRFQDQVDSLTKSGAKRVVIVPMLVSSFSGHYEQVRFLARATDSLDAEMQHHLHMSGIERSKSGTQLLVTPALDDAAQLASVVADRARVLAPSASGRALMLFGHGPNSAEDYAAWMQRLRPVADSIRARSGFASVLMELVRDDAPAHVRAEAVKRTRELILLQRAATGQDVVVVPILMSSGTMGPRAIPADLAGLPIVYDGEPLLPHPAMAEWVVGRVRGALNAPKIED
jgi:sirohydrochlorin cobaltochelatase